MKINKDIIKSFKPCEDRLDNYIHHYNNKNFTLEEFIKLEHITYNDKIWVVTRLFKKEQNVKWAIKCAESVLNNFEKVYPEDKRPRLAIEAAKNYVNNPCDETRDVARSAVWSAESAARSAVWSAESAAGYAAWSAEYVARSAVWSAEYVARSAAWSAVWSAEYVVDDTRSADVVMSAQKEQEDINLQFILEVYNET